MLEQNTKLQLLEAHNKLREASKRAASSIIDDARLLSSFERNDENGEEKVVEKKLVRGLWIELFDGVKMMLIDDDSGWTRALCQSSGLSPKHYHTYYEKIKVIDGYVQEMTTKKVYSSGDTIEHKPNILHQPFINGLVMMMWKPPLPNLHNTPSILDPVIYHIAS
jgi:hypothetical protein